MLLLKPLVVFAFSILIAMHTFTVYVGDPTALWQTFASVKDVNIHIFIEDNTIIIRKPIYWER